MSANPWRNDFRSAIRDYKNKQLTQENQGQADDTIVKSESNPIQGDRIVYTKPDLADRSGGVKIQDLDLGGDMNRSPSDIRQMIDRIDDNLDRHTNPAHSLKIDNGIDI